MPMTLRPRGFTPASLDELLARQALRLREVEAADAAVETCNEILARTNVPVRMVRSRFGHAEFPSTANTIQKIDALLSAMSERDRMTAFNPCDAHNPYYDSLFYTQGQDPDESFDYVVFYLVDPRLDGLRVSRCSRCPNTVYQSWVKALHLDRIKVDWVQQDLEPMRRLHTAAMHTVYDLPTTVYAGNPAHMDENTRVFAFDENGKMSGVFPDGIVETNLRKAWSRKKALVNASLDLPLLEELPSPWSRVEGYPVETSESRRVWEWERGVTVATHKGQETFRLGISAITTPHELRFQIQDKEHPYKGVGHVMGTAGVDSLQSLAQKWLVKMAQGVDAQEFRLGGPVWASLVLPDSRTVFQSTEVAGAKG